MDEKIASKYRIEDIKLGMKKQFRVTITNAMMNEFAELSGDYSPLHFDEEYGKKSTFNQIICYGLLLASFFSRLIGMYLPGENALCLSQSINYLLPAFIGDEITVEGEVITKSSATRIITLKTIIKNNSGKCLIDGQAKILVRN
jgi:3-hydroxybutyryl-CoA dehydratase